MDKEPHEYKVIPLKYNKVAMQQHERGSICIVEFNDKNDLANVFFTTELGQTGTRDPWGRIRYGDEFGRGRSSVEENYFITRIGGFLASYCYNSEDKEGLVRFLKHDDDSNAVFEVDFGFPIEKIDAGPVENQFIVFNQEDSDFSLSCRLVSKVGKGWEIEVEEKTKVLGSEFSIFEGHGGELEQRKVEKRKNPSIHTA